jgi:hypothetical protein
MCSIILQNLQSTIRILQQMCENFLQNLQGNSSFLKQIFQTGLLASIAMIAKAYGSVS